SSKRVEARRIVYRRNGGGERNLVGIVSKCASPPNVRPNVLRGLADDESASSIPQPSRQHAGNAVEVRSRDEADHIPGREQDQGARIGESWKINKWAGAHAELPGSLICGGSVGNDRHTTRIDRRAVRIAEHAAKQI